MCTCCSSCLCTELLNFKYRSFSQRRELNVRLLHRRAWASAHLPFVMKRMNRFTKVIWLLHISSADGARENEKLFEDFSSPFLMSAFHIEN